MTASDDLQKQLVRLREGDRTAFEALYENLKKPLFTVILRMTRDWALAEDILQEVFLKLYLSPPEPSVNPRAYLYRMARNSAIDSVRKRRSDVNLENAEQILCDPAEDLPQKIDTENAVQALPERERDIVTLHINGELKFREVAALLELPLGTVLWAYQKALRQLQTLLGGVI
ncbi:MAG: RNA polymerase sigma factor [Firmicutes bacterium]|nr:RNA polymerase sigma factor [Bacillota bacterium]